MPATRYVVGLRDTEGTYRALRVEASNMSAAKESAVRRLEDVGISAVAISAKKIDAMGRTLTRNGA